MSRVVNKKDKKRSSLLPIVLLIVLIFIAGSFINRLMADEVSGDSDDGFFSKDKNSRLNVLVFGVDATSKEDAQSTRSDSIMLLSIEPSGANPVLLSIPRDTRVEIPGRKSLDKINHAHAYGGPNLLVATVEKLLGIKINHYVRINYKSVEQVVDALGGVEIDVPMNMKYNDPYSKPPLKINIKKGLQTLDGENSIHFLRYRKGYSNQDLGRIEAQQQFAKALTDKLISPVTLIKIPQLIDIFHNNVDTNISKAKMLSYGTKALQIDTEELLKMTLPGTSSYIGNISYYLVDKEELSDIKEMLSNKNFVKYNVEVLNGIKVAGIATKYAKQLEAANIKVLATGNLKGEVVDKSYIEYLDGYKEQAQEVAKELKIKKILKVSDIKENTHIRVVVGQDLNK